MAFFRVKVKQRLFKVNIICLFSLYVLTQPGSEQTTTFAWEVFDRERKKKEIS